MDTNSNTTQFPLLKRARSPDHPQAEKASKKIKYSNSHPARDLKIIVKVDMKEETWTVSSWAMSQASRVWQSKIIRADQQESPISCVEDNIHALETLLDAAHQKSDGLPKAVTYHELLELTKLCNKYKAVAAFEGRPQEWIETLLTLKCMVHHEGWLLIACEFGDVEILPFAVDNVLMNMSSFGSYHGPDYVKRGWKLGSRDIDKSCIPTRLFATIVEVQDITMCKLLRIVYDVCASQFRPEQSPRCKHARRECDTLVYGSLIQGMRKLKIPLVESCYYVPKVSDDGLHATGDSLRTFANALKSIEIFVYPRQANGLDHSACDISREFRASIAKVLGDAPRRVLQRYLAEAEG